MRWYVDVTSIVTAETERCCVEAESWQRALQSARKIFGDNSPSSGFSIELLEDRGCRALDPLRRIRYEVQSAPDDAPLTPDGSGSVPTSSVAPPLASTVPAPVATSQPPVLVSIPSAVAVPEIVIAPDPPYPAASSFGRALPISQIIFRREEQPTESTPMAYREYVYVIPPGGDDAVARDVLLSQFEQVKASLAQIQTPKFVQLAVFDFTYTGVPPKPPVATLAWKSWRGEPLVDFPRAPKNQENAAAAMPVPAMPVRQAVQHPEPIPEPAQPIPEPVHEPEIPELDVQFTPPAPTPSPARMPVAAAMPPPAPRTPAPPNYPAAALDSTSPLPLTQRAPEGPSFPEPSSLPPSVRPPSVKTRSVRPVGMRLSADELIADLFEVMHELHFVRDAVDAGEYCLQLILEKIPSFCGIVHLYDIDRREFVISNARGPGSESLLLMRHTERDPILLMAMRRRRALVIPDPTNQIAALQRYATFGPIQSLAVAPVMQAGRFLGALEIANPLDGRPYSDAEANALTYLSEQLAGYLATRGIVTDPERIKPGFSPNAR